MPTECSPALFEFAPVETRRVVAGFDGGAITSNAGALLLGATDRAIGLVRRFAACFRDARASARIEHEVATLVGQRVFGIALGHEDLVDHDQLRHDPVLAVLAGKLEARRPDCAPLAGKSTLNRLEHAPAGEPGRYHRIGHDARGGRGAVRGPVPRRAPRLGRRGRSSSTSTPPTSRCTGTKRGASSTATTTATATCRSTSSAAGTCWRPSSGAPTSTPRPARWRRSARIVGRIRARWPRVRILLRADSGFAREALMAWCEANRVDFVFGLARNPRLVEELAIDLAWAEEDAARTGQPARRYKDFRWSTLDSWSRRRRVVGKAEWTRGEPNPRFVVTSLKRGEIDARTLYERIYCARGDMENRVKECQLDLFAGRASAATMRANQLRLWFASMAYVLLCALRRIGLPHTQFAEATCGTLRLALLRIGAQVRRSVRRIKVAMASAHPFQDEFALAHARLTAVAAR